MFVKVEIEEVDNGYIVDYLENTSDGTQKFRRKIILNGSDLRDWLYRHFGWVEEAEDADGDPTEAA